jgi:hypothetical protein
MRYSTKKIAMSAVLLASFSASSGIISEDLISANDNLITVDTTTNIGWLDWNYTINQSFENIEARTNDSNDELFGFAHATISQFESLATSLNLTLNTLTNGTDNTDLINKLGVISYGSPYTQTAGITSTNIYNNDRYAHILLSVSSIRYDNKTERLGVAEANTTHSNIGHALIIDMDAFNSLRNTNAQDSALTADNLTASNSASSSNQQVSVSEPASLAIFFAGLFGLVASQRRKV